MKPAYVAFAGTIENKRLLVISADLGEPIWPEEWLYDKLRHAWGAGFDYISGMPQGYGTEVFFTGLLAVLEPLLADILKFADGVGIDVTDRNGFMHTFGIPGYKWN